MRIGDTLAHAYSDHSVSDRLMVWEMNDRHDCCEVHKICDTVRNCFTFQESMESTTEIL